MAIAFTFSHYLDHNFKTLKSKIRYKMSQEKQEKAGTEKPNDV